MRRRIRYSGPLAGNYPAAVALVVFSLIPYLVLTSAMQPLTPVLGHSLHLSKAALELTGGMANAGYATGTVLAVVFATHLPQRRMLMIYSTLFVIASVATALAVTPGIFIAGRVLQGLLTSLMLIAAVPPLVIGWPAARMRWTAMIMDLCIFGAVAAGPVLGGVQASASAWRPLFWSVAAVGAIGWLFVVLTFEDQDPQDRSAPWAFGTALLAATGCAAAFFGASELADHRFLSLVVFAPLLTGVALVILLVVHQYGIGRPLMPVKVLATTKPVAGIIMALCSGAASVAAIELIGQVLAARSTPGHAAVLFVPELGCALLAALVFGGVFRTRAVSLLPFVGVAALAGGIVIVTGVATGPNVLVLVGSGLIGVGVGAAVAPALFVAGFSAVSTQLPRVLALVELLRAVAAFMIAPVILHIATTVNGGVRGAGIATSMWICFGIAVTGGLVAAYVWVLGRARFDAPDLDTFLAGERPAWDSPRLADGIRGERAGPGRVHHDPASLSN